ncbi:DUF4189 domain-containing protein [Nocardia huaxiensis]|uniref:DUF4189 domain-containing protein n=1 Tax=Nocardia huaxiensis TaxID=2755382 RepID=A0A7D6V769_9NOCA|nr:DUF4189 domain-containing protein [Nocardia huaxiensis]QLY29241.1 DUF4189 domain-containing protein [Nocardia huaxiensis]UFS97258.1 DUF4189 domain-containing protein [Nocardia huaxiensis]
MTVTGTTFRTFATLISAVAAVGVGYAPAAAERGPDGHLYGAFAVSGTLGDGSRQIGSSWNFPDQGAADQRALAECGDGSCVVELRFMDGCGAIAFRGNRFAGGAGPTRDDATRAAIDAVGPPWPSSISADASDPAQVFGPDCNG